MPDTIQVRIVKYPDRPQLVMRYVDPLSGKQVARSTGTTITRDAERAAAKWEAELLEDRYSKTTRCTWEYFRDAYADATRGLSVRTVETYESALNVFERHEQPKKLSQVTTERISSFVTKLRDEGLSESTVSKYLRHIRAPLRWAHDHKLLGVLPKFTMPKRAGGSKDMRGRPISAPEFKQMLDAVPEVVGKAATPAWEFYLQSMYDSGLRLSESMTLSWNDAPDAIIIDLSHKRPMLRIAAAAEKGNKDRLLPIAPEFAELLLTVPVEERTGRVFKLVSTTGVPLGGERSEVGDTVSEIGRLAGVVVDERTRKVGGVTKSVTVKYASAQDLRRSFGRRWAMLVMPAVLKELMRHASINTTMKYYVGQNAGEIAEIVWSAKSNISGNTRKRTRRKPQKTR